MHTNQNRVSGWYGFFVFLCVCLVLFVAQVDATSTKPKSKQRNSFFWKPEVTTTAEQPEMVCNGKVLAQFHGPEYEVTNMRSSNYFERAFAYIMGALPDEPVMETPISWVCPHLAGAPSCCNQRALDVLGSSVLHIRDIVRDFANKHYLKAFEHEGAVWLKQQEACTFNVTMNKIEADKGGQDNTHKTCTWWKNFVSELRTVYPKMYDEVTELFDSLVEYTKASICLFCDPSVNAMFASEYDENNNLRFEIHMRGKDIIYRITEAFLNFQTKLETAIWPTINYYFPMTSSQIAECGNDTPEWECNDGGTYMMEAIGLPKLKEFDQMLTQQLTNSTPMTNLVETFNGVSIAPFFEVLENRPIPNARSYRILIEDSDADQVERIPRKGTVLYLLDQKIEGTLDLKESFTWSVNPPEPEFEEEEQEHPNVLNISNFTMGIVVGTLIGLFIWGLFTAVIFYWLYEMKEHGLDFATRKKQRETTESIEKEEEELRRQEKKLKVAEDRRAKDLAIERAEIKREKEKQKLAEKKKKLRMQERRRAGPPIEALKRQIGIESPKSGGSPMTADSGPPSLRGAPNGGPPAGMSRPRGRVRGRGRG